MAMAAPPPEGCGTVFKITPSGALTTLYSFCPQSNCTDGSGPFAGLVQAEDGNFYGTTYEGGAGSNCPYGCGTVFKVTPSGTLTTLHSFDSTDGALPQAALVQATDGNFYGTTGERGDSSCPYGCGTVFKITPSGTLTTLHSFNGSDGSGPEAGLVQATDGNFYGTTQNGGGGFCGGGAGCGTVFKITPSGTLTTLHSFSGADGYVAFTLVRASDGNFYGTTQEGGANCGSDGCGTMFKITPGGTLTTLYNFCAQLNCTDGYYPVAGLVQGTDGKFYGTTSGGGAYRGCYEGCGTVFSFSPNPTPSPLQFVAVTPCRLVDTRPQYGGRGPIVGGTYRNFPISGAPNCSIPASATAYSLNVTVVPSGPLGFLTMWPTGEDRPLQFSTLNSLDGRIKANAAIVPAGSSGDVSVYVTNTTNVILDIDGYFAPVSGSTLAFYPLPPCRVADTRYPNSGGLGSPYLAGGQERPFPILNATACDIPSSAAAYSLNFTVVPHGPLGVLTVWPTGGSRPNVSTLNDIPGTIVANAAIVAAGAGGEVSVYPTNDADLVIDINGYFAPAGTGGLSLYPAAPCRVIDTRKVGGGLPFSGTLSPPVDVVDSPCEPPAQAQAYVLNATVVPQGGLGYLTLWPDGTGRPLPFSTLNAIDGWITSNMAIVASTNGKVDAYALGSTQLILDISAYFAP